ncbi:MAG: porin, partial [Gammaproteobacteria bacterium]|nr:porin [Gammaproteobacteria bacterium]
MQLRSVYVCFTVGLINFLVFAIGGNELIAAEKSVNVVHESGSGIKLTSSDGRYQFELGGRVMIDVAHYQEDQTTLGDGTELRRARIELEGAIYDWAYEFGLDVADEDGAAEVKDAYIEYLGWDSMKLKLGQFKQPFSLEELTSSKYITFMERALPNTFAPGRTIGVGVQTYGKNTNIGAGFFGQAYDEDQDGEGDESNSVSVRLVYAPSHEKQSVLHFGLSANYFNPASAPGDTATVGFDSRPESHLTG